MRAHEAAQQDEGMEGSWVHAYLHRKEGDQINAAYWYSPAGKPVCREPLGRGMAWHRFSVADRIDSTLPSWIYFAGTGHGQVPASRCTILSLKNFRQACFPRALQACFVQLC